MLYTFARFWFENMRIDPAHEIGGLRVNAWVSLILCVLAIVWFVVARAPRPRRNGDRVTSTPIPTAPDPAPDPAADLSQ